MAVLSQMMESRYDVMDASKELDRVRFAPSRVDRYHRRYCTMEPSHRLAALEFRRFNLVLPYGARNDHFSYPNRSLFSPKGKWLQNDLATPLGSRPSDS
ncbi:hypothetical protein BDZ94DRAFT_1306669 [Collybia nuda]|uniref:Uncharacterized protein n=1 Tax=Collybia nuda TaxID=64659 RepID=A0A9P5YBR9_9AGAR|nr:hypothetical protein BDZ94DRAFT_1306669 [Collybia nuda]